MPSVRSGVKHERCWGVLGRRGPALESILQVLGVGTLFNVNAPVQLDFRHKQVR